MAQHVIEGTWEEIESHKAELMGHMLRVTIKPEKSVTRKPTTPTHKATGSTPAKELRGFGAFKNMLPSSDKYMREKQAEIEREERHF